MGIKFPYKRTCRQFADGSYANDGKWHYLRHKDFASTPQQFIRAFFLIQKDLQTLFDYLEPSDKNLNSYSYRIHELFIRTCIEIEANCKAILLENGYIKSGDLNMNDYKKINISHRLSSYQIGLPQWRGDKQSREPFKNWANGGSLPWYSSYNAVKHDRSSQFEQASFDNLLEAVCGLVTILSAQFWQEDYIPSTGYRALEGSHDGLESAIGGFFRVKFPNDWPESERYSFSYNDISRPEFVVQNFNYNGI